MIKYHFFILISARFIKYFFTQQPDRLHILRQKPSSEAASSQAKDCLACIKENSSYRTMVCISMETQSLI